MYNKFLYTLYAMMFILIAIMIIFFNNNSRIFSISQPIDGINRYHNAELSLSLDVPADYEFKYKRHDINRELGYGPFGKAIEGYIDSNNGWRSFAFYATSADFYDGHTEGGFVYYNGESLDLSKSDEEVILKLSEKMVEFLPETYKRINISGTEGVRLYTLQDYSNASVNQHVIIPIKNKKYSNISLYGESIVISDDESWDEGLTQSERIEKVEEIILNRTELIDSEILFEKILLSIKLN